MANPHKHAEFIVEACTEDHHRNKTAARASFNGLLQEAPSGVSTSIANALSQQLIYQMQLLEPGKFVSFEDLNVDLDSAAFPYVQASARDALARAIAARGEVMQVNSSYRTVAQQMLLYNDRFNNSNPVAPPGASNHQTGLAIDIEDPRGWDPFLIEQGWEPLGGDPPHFDYLGDDVVDFRATAILAFQKLWNLNNPSAAIDEDGSFGPGTESALLQTPATGFPIAPWADSPRPLRLSTPRMEGADVFALQEKLKAAGFAIAPDGELGPKTAEAIQEFQKKKGLEVTGIATADLVNQIG
ncbi:MAG: peptidoglycan-binding protein [Alkalinema sp. RU_4_3]|nr:peptidoglycan-binding protein [Alkalinema sp. RU_4_3]